LCWTIIEGENDFSRRQWQSLWEGLAADARSRRSVDGEYARRAKCIRAAFTRRLRLRFGHRESKYEEKRDDPDLHGFLQCQRGRL
jgi:hypothetical protein